MKTEFRKNNKGLSLVELIVVILIMGIITGGAVLSFSVVVNADTERAAKKISSLISMARTQAMAEDSDTVHIEVRVFEFNGDLYAGIYKCEAGSTPVLIEPVQVREKNPLVPASKIANYKVTASAYHRTNKLFDIDNGIENDIANENSGTEYGFENAIKFSFMKSTGGVKSTQQGDSGAVTDEDSSTFCTDLVLSGGTNYRIIVVPATGKTLVKESD